VLADPPDAEAGEITDKGYVNQRAVLTRRAMRCDVCSRQRMHRSFAATAKTIAVIARQYSNLDKNNPDLMHYKR
jgi:hypothetical protein